MKILNARDMKVNLCTVIAEAADRKHLLPGGEIISNYERGTGNERNPVCLFGTETEHVNACRVD